MGGNYGERFRGVLGVRGQKTVIGDDHTPKVVGMVGEAGELASHIKKSDWNEYTIIAKGFQFVQKINGRVMSDVTDDDTTQRRATGLVALQLHAGGSMKVQFRNIRLKRFEATAIPTASYKWPPGTPAVAIAPFDAKQARAHQEAWAKHLGVQVEQTNSIGMKLALIPPGEFMMGSSPEQQAAGRKIAEDVKHPWAAGLVRDESPQHPVTLTEPYLLAMCETTIGEYKKFADESRYVSEAERLGFGDSELTKPDDKVTPEQKKMSWRAPGYPVTDNSAVAQLTWSDAVAFCNWLSERERLKPCYGRDAEDRWRVSRGGDGYRLPTEAEWEYACRAGTTSQFSFGDDPAVLDQYAWFRENSGYITQAVGTKLPNAFGLYDMHGNAWEWCQDWYGTYIYAKSPQINPIGPESGSLRVTRAGFWNRSEALCRTAVRRANVPHKRDFMSGFRVVRTAAMPEGKPEHANSATAAAASTTPPIPDDSRPPHELLHAYRQRIKAAWPGREDRLRIDEQNHLKLDLHDCQEINSLTPLAGMRLHWLSLIGCKDVGDITPLKGMPLAHLHLDGCRDLTSLEAVKGMPLEELFFSNVSDLRPLAGLKLNRLVIQGSDVTDLSPLSGSPLTTLSLLNCGRLTDLSPLKGVPLTNVSVWNCASLRNFTPLKGMKLTRLDLSYGDHISDLSAAGGHATQLFEPQSWA